MRPPRAEPPPQPIPVITAVSAAVAALERSEDEPITVASIIKEKPKTKIVREFMKATLSGIKSEDELLFGTSL